MRVRAREVDDVAPAVAAEVALADDDDAAARVDRDLPVPTRILRRQDARDVLGQQLRRRAFVEVVRVIDDALRIGDRVALDVFNADHP